jgi:hypothetical protein
MKDVVTEVSKVPGILSVAPICINIVQHALANQYRKAKVISRVFTHSHQVNKQEEFGET